MWQRQGGRWVDRREGAREGEAAREGEGEGRERERAAAGRALKHHAGFFIYTMRESERASEGEGGGEGGWEGE